MPTPAYGLKHWWRAERNPGESLKAFARRFAGPRTTSGNWLHRKSDSALVRAIDERKVRSESFRNGTNGN